MSGAEPVVQRMEWSEITAESLVWQWMRAPEGTDEFELLWRLDYRRATDTSQDSNDRSVRTIVVSAREALLTFRA